MLNQAHSKRISSVCLQPVFLSVSYKRSSDVNIYITQIYIWSGKSHQYDIPSVDRKHILRSSVSNTSKSYSLDDAAEYLLLTGKEEISPKPFQCTWCLLEVKHLWYLLLSDNVQGWRASLQFIIQIAFWVSKDQMF